jgi:hypothetical protein
MNNDYWEDKLPEENWSGIVSWLSISLVIELDLQGIERPKSFPLSEMPPTMWQPQKPETAQIFLCASSKDAKLVFQRRQIQYSVEYIERVTRDALNFQYDSAPGANGELLMSYDPRRLLDWLSIQPGQVAKLLLPEYFTMTSERPKYQDVVHSQIHMARGAENRYMAVWFDFRDEFQVHDQAFLRKRDGHNLPSIPPSTLQQQFALQSQGLLNGPIRRAMDFPGIMLLDLLKADIMMFEKATWTDHELLPVATRALGVRDYEQRLEYIEFNQSKIKTAENIHRFLTHMKAPQALDLITHEFRSDYEQSLYRLELGSSLLVSELKQQNKSAEERLNLYERFAQLRQASSLSALTYCAAFFLPMSLAATFLSMQSRARDLKEKFYDFCGISLLFSTVAVLVYFRTWQEYNSKTSYSTKPLQEGNFRLYFTGMSLRWKVWLGFLWVLTVVSFLVGMLYNISIGMFILGVVGTFDGFVRFWSYLLLSLRQRYASGPNAA